MPSPRRSPGTTASSNDWDATTCGFLPEVWVPDEPTQALRRQVTKRNQIVRQRSRLKNIIQSILHSHLIPSCPHADLCGASGRAWLLGQVLPEDEQLAIERHLREFDRLGEDLKVIERDLARSALGDEGVKRLMTIPGVDMVALATMWAKRRRPRLQYQEPPGSGAPMGRAGRDGLCPLRRRVESPWSQAGAHRRRNRGATMKAAWQGLRLTPCSSPRDRPCARGK